MSDESKTDEAPLKLFTIVEMRTDKVIYEVMARDAEHAEELHAEGEAEEVGGDCKYCEVTYVGCEDDDEEREEADEDEEEAE